MHFSAKNSGSQWDKVYTQLQDKTSTQLQDTIPGEGS